MPLFVNSVIYSPVPEEVPEELTDKGDEFLSIRTAK
jgi:hypothetical protein